MSRTVDEHGLRIWLDYALPDPPAPADPWTVIFGRQEGPRPERPYAVLRTMTRAKDCLTEYAVTDTAGSDTNLWEGHRRSSVSGTSVVTLYSDTCFDDVEVLDSSLSDPDIMQSHTGDLSICEITSIQEAVQQESAGYARAVTFTVRWRYRLQVDLEQYAITDPSFPTTIES